MYNDIKTGSRFTITRKDGSIIVGNFVSEEFNGTITIETDNSPDIDDDGQMQCEYALLRSADGYWSIVEPESVTVTIETV